MTAESKLCVLVYGDNIPSYHLAIRFLYRTDRNAFRRFKFYFSYSFLTRAINLLYAPRINVLWIIRKCDLKTVALAMFARIRGVYVIYEYDDRFDQLNTSDTVHTSIFFLTCFFWLLRNADIIKTYESRSVDKFLLPYSNKIRYGLQYTPIFSSNRLSGFAGGLSEFRLAILASNIPQDTVKRYNSLIQRLKSKFGEGIIVYSFNKLILADRYLSTCKNIEKYYSKIDSLGLSACITLGPIGNSRQAGKTPNKFREAAGFGYVCVATDSDVFSSIPDDAMIKCCNDDEVFDGVCSLVLDRRRRENIFEGTAVRRT